MATAWGVWSGAVSGAPAAPHDGSGANEIEAVVLLLVARGGAD